MAASVDDNDSYVLPEASSNDESEDSEDKTLESITRNVCDTSHELDRDPAEPEDKAEVSHAAAAAAAAAAAGNPLPATIAPVLPVDAGTAKQFLKVMVEVVEQAGQQIMDE